MSKKESLDFLEAKSPAISLESCSIVFADAKKDERLFILITYRDTPCGFLQIRIQQ